MKSITRIFNPLFNRIAFNKVEVKVENKIGFIYLNSPKDLNALSL